MVYKRQLFFNTAAHRGAIQASCYSMASKTNCTTMVFKKCCITTRTKKRHTNACSLVDIPTGWEPRTKQQPTGLIAYPAAQGRAVQLLLSAQKKKRHTNVCLFLVRVVIQHFLKTIVVQFVFEAIE